MIAPAPAASRWLWPSALLASVLFALMAWQAAPLSPPIPALQLTFSRESFNAILEQWGAEGLARFRQHFLIDFPFLISYGLFGILLAQRPAWQGIARLLPSAALLDAIENGLQLGLLTWGNEAPDLLYLVAGQVATAKWALLATFVLRAGLRRRPATPP